MYLAGGLLILSGPTLLTVPSEFLFPSVVVHPLPFNYPLSSIGIEPDAYQLSRERAIEFINQYRHAADVDHDFLKIRIWIDLQRAVILDFIPMEFGLIHRRYLSRNTSSLPFALVRVAIFIFNLDAST